MLLKMMFFELRYFIRQPSFYVVSLVMFLLSFGASMSDTVQIGGNSNVQINSPFSILQIVGILNVFSIFLIINFVGSSALRDQESKMSELIFSKPIDITSYRLGRFFGAYLVSVLTFSFCLLGILVGTEFGLLTGYLDIKQVGEHVLVHYLMPLLYLTIPSFFLIAALFQVVSIKFRSMVAMYLMGIAVLVSYLVTVNVFSGIEYREIAALVDIYGIKAVGIQTEYWTMAERNNSILSLQGELLYNRVLWLLVATVALLSVVFNRSHYISQKQKTNSKKDTNNTQANALMLKFDHKASISDGWQQFMARTLFEVKQVVKSYAFMILVIISMAMLIPAVYFGQGIYGTTNWPVTFNMVELVNGALGTFAIIVLVYYSAELVWGERESRMGDIIDSYPVANWIFWASKYLALILVFVLLYALGIMVAVSAQLVSGIEVIDFGQYVFRSGYLSVLSLAMSATLAFLLQVISPNKYIGMGLFIVYFIITQVLHQLGFEHNLQHFTSAPAAPYSDINGYGHYLTAVYWHHLYWLGVCIVMAALTYALWPRGAGQNLKARFSMINYQLGLPGKLAITMGVLLSIGTGSFIYYNTNIVNEFQTSIKAEDIAEQYEREFAQYEHAARPTTTRVHVDAQIYPQTRRIEATATLEVFNKTDAPIERILFNKPNYALEWNVQMRGGQLGEEDPKFKHAWFELNEPLQSGETRQLTLSVVRQTLGFTNGIGDTQVVNNGTFIDNFELFPSMGYSLNKVLSDKSERRKRGLPELKLGNDINESQFYGDPLFGDNFVMFSASLTTDESQIALAPGYLQDKQTKNGRTTYVYEMDAPMLHFFTIQSFDLAVKREVYKGIDIEVFYHPDHAWNIDTMIESVKDSIDYFSQAFGPYQHKQMRIIEYPRYRSFAQSFPNTVPYSENMGFIMDTRDPTDINFVYYVTAHEVAHQWFPHQVIGANVEGSNIMSETISQYAAIMVMKEKYGVQNLRKFLKYELNEYLSGRASEQHYERPLSRAVNQSYIHYNKGSVVMMALYDRIGEERLNQRLRAFLNDFQYQQQFYPTTLDLIAYLKEGASQGEQQFIEDLFNKITLYELKLSSVELEDTSSEQEEYTVTLTIQAAKKVADGVGNEEEADLSELIDIALFSADPDEIQSESATIYLQKHTITSGENVITVKVNTKPKFAGVDPFVKLIDKRASDNIRKL